MGASTNTVLTIGHKLLPGHSLRSGMVAGGPNGALSYYYQLTLNRDGNLVEYKVYPNQSSKGVFWQTATTNLGSARYLTITSTGNLVLQDAHGTWTSGTAHTGVTRLVMSTTGNMVLQTKSGRGRWASRNGLCAKVALTRGRLSTEISAACREVADNTWYTWGGGHGSKPGRTYGVYDGTPETIHDPSRLGFDCSGLTRRSTWPVGTTLRCTPVRRRSGDSGTAA